MKILAAGDIHGDIFLVRRLAEKAEKENVDLVVLCGDLTDPEEKAEHIIGPFVKKNKKVLLVPGNHESIATADFLAELYDIKNIHGYSVRYNDVGFFGSSGVTLGPHALSNTETFNLLKQGHERIKDARKKIMVTHEHPLGSKQEFSGFRGSKGIRKAIDELKPDILLCSHIHEAEGIEEVIGKTKVINVGRSGKILKI
ncbi:metallophosphoesterase [Candidatus Woesearchaeota archaeon]|nr:metallophosphoesterase [Candidatus Woesearchaeota archaeon]